MSKLESIIGNLAAAGASILLGLTSCYSDPESISVGMPLNKVKQVVAEKGIVSVRYQLMLAEADARIEKDNDDYDAYFWKDLAEKRLGIKPKDAGFNYLFLKYLNSQELSPDNIVNLQKSFIESDFMKCIYECATVRSWNSNNQSISVKYAHELLKDIIWQLDELIHSGGYQSPSDAYSDYHLRGAAKRFLGRFEEAIADFEAAIKLRPDDHLNLKKDIEDCKKEMK